MPFDVALIGAGPIGLELAVALKRASISYIHLDAHQIGHTISWFPPQTRFFSSNARISIAGLPLQTPDQNKATREEYLAYLRQVVLMHDLQINTYEPVTNIQKRNDLFELTTNPLRGPQTYHASHVILATGGTASPRLLNIPGESLPHASHYFQDPHTYFRKKVLIVGGKNSAVEAALRCHHAGADVTISYRRNEFPTQSIKYWLLPEITNLIESGKIKAHFNTVITEITPTQAMLAPCPVAFSAGGSGSTPTSSSPLNPEPRTPIPTDTDFILLLTGYIADMSLAKLAGVELSPHHLRPAFNEQTMETNIKGIYIAGTAIAGTQDSYKVFIENAHVHTDRILAHLLGRRANIPSVEYARPES